MTVAGLRFRNKVYSAMPVVTKNGIFIYEGSPADCHEWEFRAELRIVTYEHQEKRRKKKEKKSREDSSFESSGSPEGGRTERSPQAAEARAPARGIHRVSAVRGIDGRGPTQNPVKLHRRAAPMTGRLKQFFGS